VVTEKDLVELTSIACCALYCAYEHYPEVAKNLAQFVSPKTVELFRDILKNTGRLVFIHNTDAAEIYGTLAIKELEGLKNVEPKTQLSCGHIISQHKKALEPIAKMMKIDTN
jgi:hypothetical protein